jgi:DNA-binding transcriptional MerR regulator
MSEILVGQAAQILKVSENHVRYLERTGQIRCRRVGHIRVFQQVDVERLAEERLHRATGEAHWRHPERGDYYT